MLHRVQDNNAQAYAINERKENIVLMGARGRALGDASMQKMLVGYVLEDGMSFGVCFGGLKGMELKLIEIVYSFE